MIDCPTAIGLLLERVPPSVREAAKFRGRVFVGPGVILPSHLAIHLSSSLRYMFYSAPTSDIVRDAWSDFKDRLRWRVYFEQKKARGETSDEKLYDPDYEVPHERAEFNKETVAYIEAGLRVGDDYVHKFCVDVMPRVKATSRPLNLVWLSNLKSYLSDHEYMVTQTDKNLGIAVITKQWFIENTTKLWNDPLNYRKISSAERQLSLEKARTTVTELSELAESMGNDQLATFLRSKVPESEHEESVVPTFYGIPKMHKQPVKMRPIVPCHSNAQAPAAVVVSKMLKPLLEAQPWILQGSKDLAQKLSALKLDPYRKAWIVSGDIVAYYPNIPLRKCLGIVGKWWLTTEGAKYTPQERDLFLRCFQFANKGLIIDFNGETVEQIRGLAMGIACSPDLANLYGAHFENLVMEDEFMTGRMPFYGRFLDDVLGVVYAQTHDEALDIAKRIAFEDVEVEWSASEWHTPFLDMFVYIDPISKQIEHKPYRKPLNHRERIPWASHHPKDVKKGTYVGEMSRLATLSSTIEHYSDAIGDLRSLYVARGYPPDLVKKWTRENYGIRWKNRLNEPKSSPSGAFVLKSHFNPAWSAFNVHEMGKLVIDSWLSSLHSYDEAEQRRRQKERGPVVGPDLALQEVRVDPVPPVILQPAVQVRDSVQRSLVDLWAGRSWRVGEAGPSNISRAPVASTSAVSMPFSRAGTPEFAPVSMPASRAGTPLVSEPEVGLGNVQVGQSDVPKSPLIPTGELRRVGDSRGMEVVSVLDVRSVGFIDHRWIVSRKRTRNLSDFINTWKKSLLRYTPPEDVPMEDMGEWQ